MAKPEARQRCIANRVITMLSLCVLLLSPQLTFAQSLSLSGPSETIKEGYFTVSVTVNGEVEPKDLAVEASLDSDFRENVQRFPALGDFKRLSLTGFSDGTYYLRATASNIPAPSDVIKITVKHYPLWQALGLFIIGLMLFVTLVTVLLRSHWRVNKEA